MGNQQERLVSLDFAAGLIVGEGCFCFNIVRNNGRGLINPIFQLFMTDRETVEAFYATLKHHRLPGYFQTRPPRGNIREQYGVRIHGVKNIKRLADTFIPLLTGEKLQAATLAKEFCDWRLELGEKAGYGPADVDFVAQMRQINGNRTHAKIALQDLPRILRDYMPDAAIHAVKI